MRTLLGETAFNAPSGSFGAADLAVARQVGKEGYDFEAVDLAAACQVGGR